MENNEIIHTAVVVEAYNAACAIIYIALELVSGDFCVNRRAYDLNAIFMLFATVPRTVHAVKRGKPGSAGHDAKQDEQGYRLPGTS